MTLFLGVMYLSQSQVVGTPYVFAADPINAICDGTQPTTVVEIISLQTGKIWMDRNLGASRAATSAIDYLAYGCLYQWGRGNDGHASMKWMTGASVSPINGSTMTLSSSDLDLSDPSRHGLFIKSTSSPYDWRSPQNDLLWQGVTGINNPCPAGFRIPTNAEFNAEFWVEIFTFPPPDPPATVYANGSIDWLKFVTAGYLRYDNESSIDAGRYGLYWSSTTSGTQVYYRDLLRNSMLQLISRSNGLSVRCIKD